MKKIVKLTGVKGNKVRKWVVRKAREEFAKEERTDSQNDAVAVAMEEAAEFAFEKGKSVIYQVSVIINGQEVVMQVERQTVAGGVDTQATLDARTAQLIAAGIEPAPLVYKADTVRIVPRMLCDKTSQRLIAESKEEE